MQVNKNQYGRAIPIIIGEAVNIPNPSNMCLSGTSLDTVSDRLVAEGLSSNMIGYIVVNNTYPASANVVGYNAGELLLDSDIFSNGDGFSIYSPNETGCAIYIPAQTPADLRVMTVGGDLIRLSTCGSSTSHTILPINILTVTDTALTGLVALW